MRLLLAASLFVLSAVPFAWSCSHRNPPALRLCDDSFISFPHMVADIRMSDVVFVGEGHTVPSHHKAQLDVVEALAAGGKPVTIAMEMFDTSSQTELDAWISGRSSLEDFLRVYYRNWDMPWPLYRDILLSARRHGIHILGINIPRALVGKVYREGFSALSADDKKALPPGISCSIDETYRRYVRGAFHMHSSQDERSFTHFCEAQMVWNKAMAWHVGDYLKKNQGRTVVVLAGLGHAVKSGMPRQLQEYHAYRTTVILPELTGATENGLEEGDYIYQPAVEGQAAESAERHDTR